MNPLELRYLLFKTLDKDTDIDSVTLESPVPGEPVRLSARTADGRTYAIEIKEQ